MRVLQSWTCAHQFVRMQDAACISMLTCVTFINHMGIGILSRGRLCGCDRAMAYGTPVLNGSSLAQVVLEIALMAASSFFFFSST